MPRGAHEFHVLWQEAVLGERDAALVRELRELRVLRVRTLQGSKVMLQKPQVVEVANEVTRVKQGASLL